METNNENTNERFTLEDAIGMVADNLGNISFPASVLAIMAPEQILMVKQTIIDPIELARRNLIEILNAYNMAIQQAVQQRETQAEPEQEENEQEEVEDNGAENNAK